MLIDVRISRDRNVIEKELEKILNCRDLTTKIQCMWNAKQK
jgi:predicted component of type VI protein secretion system